MIILDLCVTRPWNRIATNGATYNENKLFAGLPQSEDESHDESANQEAHRQKSVKWNDLFTELTSKDEEIVRHMEEKMKIFEKHRENLKIPPLSSEANFEGASENG